MDLDIKEFVKEVKDGLQNSETGADIIKWLTIVRSLFVRGKIHASDVTEYGYRIDQMHWFFTNISDSHTQQIYKLLLTKLSVEWFSTLGSERFSSLVKPVYLQGNVKYSFVALFEASSDSER